MSDWIISKVYWYIANNELKKRWQITMMEKTSEINKGNILVRLMHTCLKQIDHK